MTLREQTRSGLTFGQILSILVLIGSMFAAWLQVNERVTANEIRIQGLEAGRMQNVTNISKLFDVIESSRKENKADFKEILDKLERHDNISKR